MSQAADTALQRAKVGLIRAEPFFGTLAMALPFVWSEALPTAGVDGQRVYFNPAFFTALPPREQLGLVAHEIMHLALEHAWRRGGREARRWNVACDYAINWDLSQHGFELPKGGLMKEAYAGLAAEEIYPRLTESASCMLDLLDPRAGADSAAADMADAADMDETAIRSALRGQVIMAAHNAGRQRGALPASIARLLDELLNPRQNWRQLLAEFLTAIVPDDYSWSRPNRRTAHLGLYLPAQQSTGALDHVAVVIDTSGSIGQKDLDYFLTEVLSIISAAFPRQLTIIPCDAQVYEPLVFDYAPQAEEVRVAASRPNALQGGGGTDMPAALDWIESHITPLPAVALVMTDGYTGFGAPRDFPVLWCITTDVVAPWGRTIAMA